jgi:sodium/pantothenate symporter
LNSDFNAILEAARPGILITFVVYTALLIILAIYSTAIMRKIPLQKYVSEFYSAGRGLGAVVIAFMVSASICSVGTFIGGPGVAWSTGLSFSLVGYAFVFTNLTVLGTIGKKTAIIARRANVTSYLGVLLKRYNNNKFIALIAGLAIIIFLIPYSASQFIGAGRMLQVVTGLDYIYGLLLFVVVVIVYSTFGGIRGISLAIVVQGIFMTAGALLLFIGVLVYIGGAEAGFRSINAVNPELLNPKVWPLSFQVALWVTFGLVYIAMPHGALASLSYKNTRGMHKAMIIGAVVVLFWSVAMVWSGVFTRALYSELPLPDFAIPYVTATVLPPFIAGITVAGAVAAAQTTVATMILVISATVVKDIYLNFISPGATDSYIRKFATAVTAVIGIAMFVLALVPPEALQWIIVYAIGGLASAFFFPFLLGLYNTRINEHGALCGIGGGLLSYIVLRMALGLDALAIVLGMLLSLILILAVSYATPRPPKSIIELFWGASPPQQTKIQ